MINARPGWAGPGVLRPATSLLAGLGRLALVRLALDGDADGGDSLSIPQRTHSLNEGGAATTMNEDDAGNFALACIGKAY